MNNKLNKINELLNQLNIDCTIINDDLNSVLTRSRNKIVSIKTRIEDEKYRLSQSKSKLARTSRFIGRTGSTINKKFNIGQTAGKLGSSSLGAVGNSIGGMGAAFLGLNPEKGKVVGDLLNAGITNLFKKTGDQDAKAKIKEKHLMDIKRRNSGSEYIVQVTYSGSDIKDLYYKLNHRTLMDNDKTKILYHFHRKALDKKDAVQLFSDYWDTVKDTDAYSGISYTIKKVYKNL